jgi:hypothetical protein
MDARGYISGVDLYSSETGRWVYKEKGWDEDVTLAEPQSATVFLDSYMHLCTACGRISAVDTKGETWSSFHTPCAPYFGLIQQSQGRLLYATFNYGQYNDDDYIPQKNNDDDYEEWQLKVYALEDYANKQWILKHRVGLLNLEAFGGALQGAFDWVAIHPERDSMFYIQGTYGDNMLMSYSMDDESATELRALGEAAQPPYLPYVPLYTKLESLCK